MEDTPPFFDRLSCLKSRTVQILLLSTGVSACGVSTPLYYLLLQLKEEGVAEGAVLLLVGYLAIAWSLGCSIAGCLVAGSVGEYRLCQVSLLISSISILSLPSVVSNNGYVIFVWIYGIFMGGYNYSLKMCVYQKVRARNFSLAWGYIQCSQALPNMIGVPIAGYINIGWGSKAGYYFSGICVLLPPPETIISA